MSAVRFGKLRVKTGRVNVDGYKTWRGDYIMNNGHAGIVSFRNEIYALLLYKDLMIWQNLI